MLMYAYAPSRAVAPELYAKLTWVKELGLSWDDLGGISREEINLLAELVNIKAEADRVKADVERRGR